MSRPLVGVDLCNTVAEIDAALRRHFNVPPQLRQRDLKGFGATPEFFRSEAGLRIFEEAQPIPGAVEGVRELIRLGYEVVYLTARPVQAIQVSRIWLARHGFPRPTNVLCTEDKPAACRRLGVAVAIDDWPPEIRRLAGVVPVVIHRRWYNEEGYFGYTWAEIPTAVTRAIVAGRKSAA